jgi:protein phosphatase
LGDSRAYLWRQGELHQLTHDHSGAAALVAAGILTTDVARGHTLAHQLYRYLGGPQQAAQADIARHPLAPGDTVLLCSDGLWNMLRDSEIAAVLASAPDLDAAAGTLIAAANAAGGEDNITVVLAQLVEGDG